MATETESETVKVKVPKTKPCACLIGASGVDGEGSKLEYVDNPRVVCDRVTSKSFAQGHDARLSSRLATEVANGLITVQDAVKLVEAAGGSPMLVSKVKHSATLRTEKEKAKAKKAATTPADTAE